MTTNLAALVRELPPFDFDRTWGVRTELRLAGESEGGSYPGQGHQATTPAHFRAVLRAGRLRPEGLTLVDVGCGCGRVVLLAARRPFRRVIGVELSAELAALARANLESFRGRIRCGAVELVESDALAFPLPPGPTLVWFYNSFDGPPFGAFLDRLEAAFDTGTRPLRLAYSNPIEAARVEARVRFRRLHRGRSPREPLRPGNRDFALYEVLPAGATG